MSAFEKWSIWITSILTGVTGLGYFWTKYLTESASAFSVVNHPLQPWFLKAHILVSPFLLLAVGTVLVRHIWKHYRQGVGKGRRTGMVAGGVLLPMVITGYLIQSVTHQGWLEALAIAHIVFGVLYLAGLGLHQLVVRVVNGNGNGKGSRGRRRWRGEPHRGDDDQPGTAAFRRSGLNPGRARTNGARLESADRA